MSIDKSEQSVSYTEFSQCFIGNKDPSRLHGSSKDVAGLL